MKKNIFIPLCCLLWMFCFNNSYAVLKIVSTTEDLAAIAKAIGADQVQVVSLTPGTRDPHFAEAKPSMIHKVFSANLLLLIGADLESAWLPAVLRSSRNAKVQPGKPGYLDLSQSVKILARSHTHIDRSMGDVHAAGNPHYWLNPDNGLLIAKAIKNRLSQLDANHTDFYHENFSRFANQLTEKKQQWQQALMFLHNKPVIAYHNSLLYLADFFQFTIEKELEPKPGISPGASHLASLVQLIHKKNIQWLIMEPYYEQRSADFLKRKTNIKLVIIPQSVGARPEITNYFQLFDAIVNSFQAVQ